VSTRRNDHRPRGRQGRWVRNGNEHNILNSNVLIEIGVAPPLYRRNFILLVERGRGYSATYKVCARCDMTAGSWIMNRSWIA